MARDKISCTGEDKRLMRTGIAPASDKASLTVHCSDILHNAEAAIDCISTLSRGSNLTSAGMPPDQRRKNCMP